MIDLIVASTLMSMGMIMLPPVFISLPFKILLFVLVDGWSLVTESLVQSFTDMDQDTVIQPRACRRWSWRMKVALPLLLVGLVVGLIVVVFQAVTQIQEQSLSFIPKIVGVAVVMLIVAGPWMLDQLAAGPSIGGALPLDPGARGRPDGPRQRCSRSSASTQVAGFFLVLARVSPLFLARAAVLEQDDPGARARRSSPSPSPSASRRVVVHGQPVPDDVLALLRPRA